MDDRLKELILLLARSVGLFRLSRWLTRRNLRILCYHGIWLGEPGTNPFNYLYMEPDRFARRMSLLRRLRYPVLPLAEALRALDAEKLPPASVVITIDDGWYGTFSYMVPEVLRQKLPASIYLTTYYAEKQTAVFGVALQYLLQSSPVRRLDCSALLLPPGGTIDLDDVSSRAHLHEVLCSHANKHMKAEQRETLLFQIANALGADWRHIAKERQFHLMSLGEAHDCAARGIDFQLHTHRHRLTGTNGGVCISEEIKENRERLSKISQRAAEHFCYPSGEWAPEHLPHLRAMGVISATTTENGLCSRDTERLALPRILDGDRVSELEFEAELSGLMEIGRQLKSRLKRMKRTV